VTVPPSQRTDPYGQLLGVEVVEVGDGSASAELTAGERHTNFLGLVHGGAVFSLADAALAAASNSGDRTAVATVVTIHLLRACRPTGCWRRRCGSTSAAASASTASPCSACPNATSSPWHKARSAWRLGSGRERQPERPWAVGLRTIIAGMDGTRAAAGEPARATGRAMDRVEAREKVTGTARYAVEHERDRVAWAVGVQAAIAKGTVRSVDATDALALPGVLAVLWHGDAPRLHEADNPELALFQTDRVAYPGQLVAAVVATSQEAARQAERPIQLDEALDQLG
jgi:uncharacterized protein (TIGR00369 family)